MGRQELINFFYQIFECFVNFSFVNNCVSQSFNCPWVQRWLWQHFSNALSSQILKIPLWKCAKSRRIKEEKIWIHFINCMHTS